ncbi:FAD-dependent oxidoreductase [Halioxenophilus aromaticivorans]|uniref:D-amino-acid oxidase n=1 Tax=Halioxenophilus aromaticivorans TaxID=1306992 RepID=A0AAV3U8Y7_9ALTE
MERRQFIRAASAMAGSLALGGCATAATKPTPLSNPQQSPLSVKVPPLPMIDARVDRIVAMNVCTRPFRAMGPRIEAEKMAAKTVVHNYGHGGSGWSLSWGSAAAATDLALNAGAKQVAVIGCGAIGLTTAIEAQRRGLDVSIYAKERPPYVRSAYATGIWSPDSRIVSLQHAEPFAARWKTMAQTSYRRFQTLLGLEGAPVEWTQIYNLSDVPFGSSVHHEPAGEPDYPNFSRDLLPGLTPQPVAIPNKVNPFAAAHVKRHPLLMFNIGEYSELLLNRFHQNGGRIINADFASSSEFAALDESTVINCTGYGARALLNDDSITPVRGQTCKLIPQPEINYGIWFWDKQVSVYPRRDGLLVQAQADGDFGNPNAVVDPQESEAAVRRLADIIAEMKTV